MQASFSLSYLATVILNGLTLNLYSPGLSEVFLNLLPYLGLSERKPYPNRVILDDHDPLGAKIVDKVIGVKNGTAVNSNTAGRTIGEQAMLLDDAIWRMQALKNSTEVAQVMISRSVVMQVLTLLSIR